jgi:hypothetical protein
LVRERNKPSKQILTANIAPSYSKFQYVKWLGFKNSTYNGNPVIPLQCPLRVLWEQGTYLALKLLAVPANTDSQTYSMSVCFFNNSTPEEWLMFQKDLA